MTTKKVNNVSTLIKLMGHQGRWLTPLVLLLVVIVAIIVLIFRDHVLALENAGYLGIFLISLMGSASIVIPTPAMASVLAGGAFMNPLAVGIISGIASGFGEITGYLAGISGRTLLDTRPHYVRIRSWMQKKGTYVLFFMAIIPNPIFDFIGIAAGALRFPIWRFLLACSTGKIIRNTGIAYTGYYSVDWLEGLIEAIFS